MSLSGDNVDILNDMYYKFLVHDCMWSGTCKEDNTHETTNKFSDFSYFSTSPVYGSIFDIFNIDDENSLGELNNCDPDYDTSDQDDSPLNGLSTEDSTTATTYDDNLLNHPSCSSSPTPSTSSSISTLTGSSIITPTGLVANSNDLTSIINKPTTSTSRATTSTGKSTTAATSSSTIKSTLSFKATKSSSKANSIKLSSTASTIRSAATSVATNSLVNQTISPIANLTPTISNTIIKTETIPSINDATVATSAVGTSAVVPSTAASTSSILKNTGKARNSKSLYPERRKEHNNSEKKRRDHLRNAFNHLRDQIPKLKDGEKKAARVTILKESVSYVTLLKEKHRYLERTKNAETIKHENLLKKLKMLQSSNGTSLYINNNNNSTNNSNDSNIVYVQCNSSTVC